MFIGSGFGLNRVSAAGDAYGILNGRFRPALVMDFGDEYYRANGASQTFSDAITHTRASTATMVDSDGALKWGPHNGSV
jgi:glutamate synthase domain-containing protein 1